MKLIALISIFVSFSDAFADFDLEAIENDLKGKGLIGSIHGSTKALDLFTFTYRNPDNFFEHIEFPMITKEPTIKKQLQTLKRHDKIKLKGKFFENKAPIKHIEVAEIEIIEKFEDGMKTAPYQYQAKLPEELQDKSEFVGKVHAVADEGRVLVVEYKDAVIPVAVRDNSLTKDLYRNDTIQIKFVVREHPGSPLHLSLNTGAPNPLVVLDKQKELHGKSGTVEGSLILFPKSPQVLFNVFAVQQTDRFGVTREFTVLNFDPKVFEKAREKFQRAWDEKATQAPSTVENSRNKYVNRSIRVKVTGNFNVVDAGQANPQVLITGPEAIELLQ